jgi:hypothetical protein
MPAFSYRTGFLSVDVQVAIGLERFDGDVTVMTMSCIND